MGLPADVWCHSAAIEVKFKDRSKYALSVDLVRDQTVIEKIKKTRVDEAGVLKWNLQSW